MDPQSCYKLTGGNILWFLALIFFGGEGGGSDCSLQGNITL